MRLPTLPCIFPGERLCAASLGWQNGRLTAPHFEGAVEETPQQLLTPGLVDVHVNGIHTHNFDQGPDALIAATQIFPRYGTTSVAPTMQPVIAEPWLNTLAAVAAAIPRAEGARVLGLHLEGPFVALAGAATDPRPGDIGLLEELLDRCQGQLRIMSVSPEVPHILPVIEYLVGAGVVPFITHTAASVEETERAVDAGARHATHFYDVFPIPREQDPGVRMAGVVETVLADPRATCDFICDGVHVHPMAVRAAVAAKGWQGVSLITDGNVGAGLGPGIYETPWGYRVRLEEGNAPRIADAGHPMQGCLAGSALTMDAGMNNLLRWLNLPLEQIWAMGTVNPARVIGDPHLGAIREGAQADLVHWQREGDRWRVSKTWVAGRLVYDADA